MASRVLSVEFRTVFVVIPESANEHTISDNSTLPEEISGNDSFVIPATVATTASCMIDAKP